ADDREFLTRVFYMEIYNEEINNLLTLEGQKLRIHESLDAHCQESSLWTDALKHHTVVYQVLGGATRKGQRQLVFTCWFSAGWRAAKSRWGEQSDDVFDALAGDFMKPRIQEVDQLLKLGVNVTVYSGQLDLICATKGTMDWVQKLKWDDLNSFLSSPRTPIYCNKEGQSGTQAFVKFYKNLNFYWILEAGHM
ncbi:hypothetical protein ACJX0J_030369, partial [Zea mays]